MINDLLPQDFDGASDGMLPTTTCSPIYSASTGTNADLFPGILRIYFHKGARIADVTFGMGVFWRNVPRGDYDLLASDLKTGIDFTDLPYADESLDGVVLDPPYMPTEKTGCEARSSRYGIRRDFGAVKWYDRVLLDYQEGIAEADRVLKKRGIMVVKCQDMVCANKQRLTHCDIITFCEKIGWVCEDLFVLVQHKNRSHPAKRQVHARKNHSYFLVFRRHDAKWDGLKANS